MITISNYTDAVKSINFDKAPAALKEGHSSFSELSEFYNDDADIKQTIDLYLSTLNKWVGTNNEDKGTKAAKAEKASAKKVAKAPKAPKPPKEKKAPAKKVVKAPKAPKPPKAAKPKKVKAAKPVAAKPIKTSRVKTPELNLISAFIGLNKKAVSVATFQKKLKDAEALQTINHKALIAEIKEKLEKGIEAAKADGSGKIKATIAPEFVAQCKNTVKNAKELLRVSYLGAAKKKR